MAYSTEIANVLTHQLAKFVTLNRHQLAGQVANLDFWLDEVRHCLAVLAGYSQRFEQLKAGQQKYVSRHHTIEFKLRKPCSTQQPAAPPKRMSHDVLSAAQQSLRENTYRFLVRCFNDGFIAKAKLRRICDGLEIGIEASDLKRN